MPIIHWEKLIWSWYISLTPCDSFPPNWLCTLSGTVKKPLKPERCLTGLDNFDNIRAADGILPPLTQFNAGIMPSMLV